MTAAGCSDFEEEADTGQQRLHPDAGFDGWFHPDDLDFGLKCGALLEGTGSFVPILGDEKESAADDRMRTCDPRGVWTISVTSTATIGECASVPLEEWYEYYVEEDEDGRYVVSAWTPKLPVHDPVPFRIGVSTVNGDCVLGVAYGAPENAERHHFELELEGRAIYVAGAYKLSEPLPQP